MLNLDPIVEINLINEAIKKYADFEHGTTELLTKPIAGSRDSVISYFVNPYGGKLENFDFVISFHLPVYCSLSLIPSDGIQIKVFEKVVAKKLLLERSSLLLEDIDDLGVCDNYTEYKKDDINGYVFGIYSAENVFTNSFIYCSGVTARFMHI